MSKLSENLKTLRKSRELKQKDVADMLGISRLSYANYETETSLPPLDRLCKLADFYGVTVGELLGRKKLEDEIAARYGLGVFEKSVLFGFLKLPHDKREKVAKSIMN